MADKTAVGAPDPEGFGDEPSAIDAVLASEFPGITSVDPDQVVDRMKARVRRADSIDELFDSLEGNSSDKLIGHRFEFIEVAWQPYESQHGTIPQAVCQAVDLDTGEATEFVTTGTMLVEFLRRAQVLGALPFRAKIVEKTTKRGQKALNFERA